MEHSAGQFGAAVQLRCKISFGDFLLGICELYRCDFVFVKRLQNIFADVAFQGVLAAQHSGGAAVFQSEFDVLVVCISAHCSNSSGLCALSCAKPVTVPSFSMPMATLPPAEFAMAVIIFARSLGLILALLRSKY